MNYLAHAFLSFNDPEVLVGNMISDFVKGRKKYDYPFRIQSGIMLHRLIDSYTDDHPATRQAKEFFRPAYRLYSGAFVDIVYDHFLAIEETEFSETSLFDFSQSVYSVLENYRDWFPTPFSAMFPYMQNQNWLYNYRTRRGTERSFNGLVRRSMYLEESDSASHLLEAHYQPLQACFRHFWGEAKPFIYRQYESLNG